MKYLIVVLVLTSAFAISLTSKNKNTQADSANKPSAPPQLAKQGSDGDDRQEGQSKAQEFPAKQSMKKGKELKRQRKKDDSNSSEPSSSTSTISNNGPNPKKASNSAAKSRPPSTKGKSASKPKNSNVKANKENSVSIAKSANAVSSDSAKSPQEHPRDWLAMFFVYFAILCALCCGFRYVYFPNESAFVILLDLMMAASNTLRPKSRGYEAPYCNEQMAEQNSITEGYSDEQGRELFWEKNSVEGI